MYSGITLSKHSGSILGTHQKVDRAARHHIETLLKTTESFPSIKEILRFEGTDGPDGIKRKSPSKDEPRYFVDPADEADGDLLKLAQDHYNNLVKSLKDNNTERSAFEAAWLAHTIVDGLTPAHHFPFDEKLEEIGVEEADRDSLKKRIVLPGSTLSEKLLNNYKYWGPKGLMMSHSMFEIGVATLTLPMSFKKKVPILSRSTRKRHSNFAEWFKEQVKEVAELGIYDEFQNHGWTAQLAWQVRTELMPSLVHAVAYAWFSAAVDADVAKVKK